MIVALDSSVLQSYIEAEQLRSVLCCVCLLFLNLEIRFVYLSVFSQRTLGQSAFTNRIIQYERGLKRESALLLSFEYLLSFHRPIDVN